MTPPPPHGGSAPAAPPLRLRRLAWRNVFDIRHERLDGLLADENNRKRIEDRVLPLAVDRRAKIRGAYWKLVVAVIVLHAALYASVFDRELEISVIGIAIKRIAGMREWMVLVGALLSTAALMLAAYDAFLASFIKRSLRVIYGVELGAMLEPVYLEFSLAGAVQLPAIDRLVPHRASFIILLAAIAATLSLTLLALALSTVMYVHILVDVALRSSLSPWLVALMVGSAAGAMLVGIGALAVAIATPYHDYVGLADLQRLQAENPDEWRRQLDLVNEREVGRRDRTAIVRGVVAMVVALALGAALRTAAWPQGLPAVITLGAVGLVAAYALGAHGSPALRRRETRALAEAAGGVPGAAERSVRSWRRGFLAAQLALAAAVLLAVWRL